MKFSNYYAYAVPPARPDIDAALLDLKLPDSPLLGVEVEIEGVELPLENALWSTVHEGSLRSGFEVKTIPLYLKELPYALQLLNQWLDKNDHQFTEYTSVHVHMDYRDCSYVDLIKLMLLHSLFERYLFWFAGAKRIDSNFCVPFCHTSFTRTMQKILYAFDKDALTFDDLQEKLNETLSEKYAAFNIQNLIGYAVRNAACFGTIEYRHMEGNANPNHILQWCVFLVLLHNAALRMNYHELKAKILALNTTSEYGLFAEDVFGAMWRQLVPANLDWGSLAESVALTKECFLPPVNTVKAKESYLTSVLATKLKKAAETIKADKMKERR